MKKLLALSVTLALAGFLGWRIHSQVASRQEGAKPGKPATTVVTAAAVVRKDVPVELRAFGTVEPFSTVDIRAQITGLITAAKIVEGQTVREGDLLFTIDARPFEVALQQAEAILARDKAQQENAETELRREAELLQKGFASEDVRDQARTAVQVLAATIRADEAAVEAARIQLGYCTIRSPLNGQTGSLLVHPGNLATINEITLVTINQTQPIKVAFSVPQQELPAIVQMMATNKLVVQLTARQDEEPDIGELSFVDNAIDRATGTIGLKATFANEQRRLWPGQFVSVLLTLATERDALVVPSQAVQSGQQGSYVFVIKPDMTVEARPVAVKRTRNGDAVLAQGLQAGEQIVTDGQMRLAPGAKVEIKTANGG